MQQSAKNYYNKGAHYFPDIQGGSHVVLQIPELNSGDPYGTVISIDPYFQYQVKMKSDKYY